LSSRLITLSSFAVIGIYRREQGVRSHSPAFKYVLGPFAMFSHSRGNVHLADELAFKAVYNDRWH